MSDWRRNGQERFLLEKTFGKVVFPEFWEASCTRKNKFFRSVEAEAKQYAKRTENGEDALDEKEIQRFWHRHCEFCWDKALTYEPCVFYCTEDLHYWVCEECFHDFQEEFQWKQTPTEELLEMR